VDLGFWTLGRGTTSYRTAGFPMVTGNRRSGELDASIRLLEIERQGNLYSANPKDAFWLVLPLNRAS